MKEGGAALVTPSGQIALWHGVLVPDAEDVAEWLGWLGRDRDAVFPISWRAVYHPPGDDLAGTLPGFAVFRGGEQQFV